MRLIHRSLGEKEENFGERERGITCHEFHNHNCSSPAPIYMPALKINPLRLEVPAGYPHLEIKLSVATGDNDGKAICHFMLYRLKPRSCDSSSH